MSEFNLPASLPEALRRAARDHPNLGIGIFDGRGRRVERRTYPEILEGASAFAARFATMGIAEREPVLVAMPTSWNWLDTWFGLLFLGAWPVASSGAGAMAAAAAQYEKNEKVMAKIGARHVVSGDPFRERAREQGYDWTADAVITVDEVRAATPARGVTPPRVDATDTAFLQLTSGSTGLPRAVMISHLAALHNPMCCTEAIGAPHGSPVHEWATTTASWLPLYHDMGLVGGVLIPIVTGLDSWLLRPQSFLARPRLWLEQIASRGATFVTAPNFGYQLCVERITADEVDGLDLSGWSAALTGAEMIRPETTEAFCDRFAHLGFRREAFRPCYGLAEGTVAVTFDLRGEGVRTRPMPSGGDNGFGLSEVVCTGVPIRDTRVDILSPAGTVLPEDRIGEVRFTGPGMFSGYFNDPEATADSVRGGWFHTGDLGFLHDGELYITGRTKELLIVRGQNLMPDDLERLADQVTGGGGLVRSAAFSVARDSEGEQPILVVESREKDSETLAGIEHDIKVAIGRNLGLPLADLVFVRRGRIPRTTSGKMQRGELRRKYLNGELVDVRAE